jgi:hypothetical protein
MDGMKHSTSKLQHPEKHQALIGRFLQQFFWMLDVGIWMFEPVASPVAGFNLFI